MLHEYQLNLRLINVLHPVQERECARVTYLLKKLTKIVWEILIVFEDIFSNALSVTNIKQHAQIQGFHLFQVSDV